MELTILGSGGWGGIPAAFCNCRVCNIASENPTGKDNRTRPQFAVSTEKGKFLIEVSPDIRLQSTRFHLPEIKEFLISHDHFDHMSGVMQLNSWIKYIVQEKPTIYCSSWTDEKLDLKREAVPKEIKLLKPYKTFSLYGVVITPLPVYHESKVDKKVPEKKLAKEFGFLLEYEDKKAAYLGDYYALPDKSFKLIRNVDIVIMDGTYLFEEEYPDKPEQNGLKDDPDHMHGQAILDFAKKIQASKTIFTNITHLSERTHEELQSLLPEGYFIAYDGMELSL